MTLVESPTAVNATSATDQIPRSAFRVPRLRVALYNVTTTTKVGGVETFVWALAGHLAAAGHLVDIIGGAGGGGLTGSPGPGGRVRRAPFVRRGGVRRAPGGRPLFWPPKLGARLAI